jgi:hypothetical protein
MQQQELMRTNLRPLAMWLAAVAAATASYAADPPPPPPPPIASTDVVFDESDGILAVEAEHFYKQTLTEQRARYLFHSDSSPEITPDGDGSITISGELKQWHKVTLTLDGPYAHENDNDNDPNPFTDRAFNVTFIHESGDPKYTVPGYFAADGSAGNSSADSGTKWRAHLSPDKAGTWNYITSFNTGKNAALGKSAIKPALGNAKTGSFSITASDNSKYCLAKNGELYLIYLPEGGTSLDLTNDAEGTFNVQ